MGRLLIIVGYGWTGIAAALILIGYAMIWINRGFGALAEILSPFNVVNFVAVLVTLAPGLLAIHYGRKIANKKINKPDSSGS